MLVIIIIIEFKCFDFVFPILMLIAILTLRTLPNAQQTLIIVCG